MTEERQMQKQLEELFRSVKETSKGLDAKDRCHSKQNGRTGAKAGSKCTPKVLAKTKVK